MVVSQGAWKELDRDTALEHHINFQLINNAWHVPYLPSHIPTRRLRNPNKGGWPNSREDIHTKRKLHELYKSLMKNQNIMVSNKRWKKLLPVIKKDTRFKIIANCIKIHRNVCNTPLPQFLYFKQHRDNREHFDLALQSVKPRIDRGAANSQEWRIINSTTALEKHISFELRGHIWHIHYLPANFESEAVLTANNIEKRQQEAGYSAR